MTALEDIYLPYRPKRPTRATIAREKGLEPLAAALLGQSPMTDPVREAQTFVNVEEGSTRLRKHWPAHAYTGRNLQRRHRYPRVVAIPLCPGRNPALHSRQGQGRRGGEIARPFPIRGADLKTPAHRLLAAFRGETEGSLKLSISPPEERGLSVLSRHVLKGKSLASGQIIEAMNDGYHRLLEPSIENDVRRDVKGGGRRGGHSGFLP